MLKSPPIIHWQLRSKLVSSKTLVTRSKKKHCKDASAEANEFNAIHEKLNHLASALNTMAPVGKRAKKGL